MQIGVHGHLGAADAVRGVGWCCSVCVDWWGARRTPRDKVVMAAKTLFLVLVLSTRPDQAIEATTRPHNKKRHAEAEVIRVPRSHDGCRRPTRVLAFHRMANGKTHRHGHEPVAISH